MVTNEPWAGLHEDLLAAKKLAYDPSGFRCSQPVPEPESAEYAAHGFTIDGLSVRFRVAKTTPTKVGQFVTEYGIDLFVQQEARLPRLSAVGDHGQSPGEQNSGIADKVLLGFHRGRLCRYDARPRPLRPLSNDDPNTPLWPRG
ncbi:conserved hypothetical protein [Streptomyces himastatinicus ATCC 53653]|uniref:Uncharacterized protein n=1 Tax=Streptomyces himastatinicus ATCC 53653 TaxID=457427 RepID=D9WGJ0_9ACTN|nr:MepB family protein [Streptomyces himastatinicus]EFL25378.1 conserved hypothetical protein [Streptomyces himastatinicus ATCC 53653]